MSPTSVTTAASSRLVAIAFSSFVVTRRVKFARSSASAPRALSAAARASATAMAATNPLDDDDAAIIAQFWTEDARVPVHAVSQSVYSVVFCEPIERLIIDRFGPKEVRPCTKKRFEELQEKGLHNHIWD